MQNVHTREDLQAAYKYLTDTLLHPWSKYLKKPAPTRFKCFWNQELETLAKERSHQYRRAVRAQSPLDWEEYKWVAQSKESAKQRVL